MSINPVKTGYSAIADEWIGIKPGTDGAFVMALIHELLHADKIDLVPGALHQRAMAGDTGPGAAMSCSPAGGRRAAVLGQQHRPSCRRTPRRHRRE